MKVSVIIPTYNEQDVILDCLKSLSHQSFKDFEVIVVDDDSTDFTVGKISELKIKNYKLKIIHTVHSGAGGARNEGAKHANGEILVFVDADMTLDVNFLKKLTEPIRKDLSKGTFSKEEYVKNWDSVWSRCWNINEGWEDKKRHPKNYPNTQPVFRAILRSEFNKVGGFTPGGYNDDWSLSKKLGYQATRASEAVFYHENPDNLNEIFNHAIWIGKRDYKLGLVGSLLALVRANMVFSLLIGVYKGILNSNFSFIVFKVVYDLGISVGIIKYLFTRKGAK